MLVYTRCENALNLLEIGGSCATKNIAGHNLSAKRQPGGLSRDGSPKT